MIFFKKKKKVSVYLQGGLGNQLFQIAAVLHYAKKFDYKPVINDVKKLHDREGDVGGYTYFDVFDEQNLFQLKKINYNRFYNYYQEKNPKDHFIKIPKNILLIGYFAGARFTDFVKQEMLEYLLGTKSVKTKIDTIYSVMIEKLGTEELLSVHIRRGDYLKLSKFHANLTIDYYEKGVKKFPENMPIIIFSNDRDWCEEVFSEKFKNPLYFVSEVDYIELLLMSKIKNNIIANSTFSWWSAYMNEHKDKRVLAPKKWFGPEGPKDWSHLYCEGWEQI